jgi:hypothetical protein
VKHDKDEEEENGCEKTQTQRSRRRLGLRVGRLEASIREIIDQCNHEQKGTKRVLVAWRAKLEKEPTLLLPFQIDEIMREVRQRLSNLGR